MVMELDEEKAKHAQDQAQGDDVTYMLEKERERLRGDIDREKTAAKKMEKELRRSTATLEEEREKHKQIVIMLMKERKRIITRLLQFSLKPLSNNFNEHTFTCSYPTL